MELQLECPPWVRVALATFPPITVRARMEGLVGISLDLPLGNPTVIKTKKKKNYNLFQILGVSIEPIVCPSGSAIMHTYQLFFFPLA